MDGRRHKARSVGGPRERHPSAVGVADATTRRRDGQSITVDGARNCYLGEMVRPAFGIPAPHHYRDT